ncbi:MAG: hypothetical protein JWQ02_1835 [Capsulimonas sp.]|nr:hypothetical protein [Capsulimonas sp.]
MGVRVDRAMVELRGAFKQRSKPRTIGHCRICYEPSDIQKFLSLDPARMSENDFLPILWDGCRCFGDWAEIAYCIPWVLDFCFDNWFVWGHEFLSVLVRASEEEGAPMLPEEQEAILSVMQAHLEEDMEQSEGDDSSYIDETITCLGAFEGSLAPLFAHLRGSENSHVRANYCLFVAKQALLKPKRAPMPPKNQKAFTELLEPEMALSVLMANIDNVHHIAPEDQYHVDYAFDYLTNFIKSRVNL